jgi:hypothetical protein
MSESPEVERNTHSPKGKINIEKTPEPPPRLTDLTEPVQVKDRTLKQMPSGNLENAGPTDNMQST